MSSGFQLDESALFDTLSHAGEVELPHSDHRNDLPIFRYRDEIIKNIRTHPSKLIKFTVSFCSNLFLFYFLSCHDIRSNRLWKINTSSSIHLR